MPIPFGKAVDFVFNAGAIPRTYALNSARKHRRLLKSLLKDLMHLGVCIGYPTAHLLLQGLALGPVGEFTWLFVPFLFFHDGIIQATAIHSGRCSCLHPPAGQAHRL